MTTKEPKEALSTKTIELDGGRRVSYVCLPASAATTSPTKHAVVHFGPLSGCAAATLPWAEAWQQHKTAASLITVDRPGCHETSSVFTPGKEQAESWELQRLRVNTENILQVLEIEQIETVHILAVCLGHAYAIDFARALLPQQPSRNSRDSNGQAKKIQLQGISLVAPFVSTACPNTWFLARLGSWVPSMVLEGATVVMNSIGAVLSPLFLSPSAVKRMLSPTEQTAWRDPEDYEQAVRMVLDVTGPMTKAVKAIEANFGASPVWQQVIDDFAQQAGYGLRLGDGDDHNADGSSKAGPYQAPFLFPPIKMHVSPHDGMVKLAAATWLAQRCYADCEIVSHPEMSSHLPMTLFGGPPRNPRLLLHICEHEFGVLISAPSSGTLS